MSNLSTQIIVGGHAEQALDAMMKTANAVRETAKIAGASAREQYESYQLSIRGIKEEQEASETALRAKIASSARAQAVWQREKVAQDQAIDAAQAAARAQEIAALKADILARSQTQAASTARAYGDTLRMLGVESRAAAASQQMLGESVGFGTAKMGYASASVRTLEGHIGTNTRAVERFISETLGLAPVLEAAFPIVGAVALIGMLVELGKKAYDAFQNIFNLKSAIEGLDKAEITVTQRVKREQDKQEQSVEDILEKGPGGHEAALRQHQKYSGDKPVGLEDYFYSKEFSGLADDVKGNHEEMYKSVAPADLPDRLSKIRTEIEAINGAIEQNTKFGGLGMVVTNPGGYGPKDTRNPDQYLQARLKLATQIQEQLEAQSSSRGAELQAGQSNIASAHEAAVKLAQDKAREAARQAQAAQQKADADHLRALEEEFALRKSAMPMQSYETQPNYEQRVRSSEIGFYAQHARDFSPGSEQQKTIQVAMQKLIQEYNQEANKMATGLAHMLSDAGPSPSSEKLRGTDEDRLAANKAEVDAAAAAQQLALKLQQAAIAQDLQMGTISRYDAAVQLAAIHTQSYQDARNKLEADRAAIAGDQGLDQEQRRGKLAGADSQVKLLDMNYQAQHETDQRDISSQTTLGAWKTALDQFVQQSRDTASQVREIWSNALSSVNEEIVKVISTRHNYNTRVEFGNIGASMFRNVASAGLQKGEGALMGLIPGLHLGGKPDGTAGNPLHVILARAMGGASSIGGAVSDVAKSASGSAGGFLSSIGGFASKLFSGLGFADGGMPPVGMASLVGENGPELFVPKVSGTVVPNSSMGGGDTHHNWNIDARGANDPAAVNQAVQRGIAKAMPSIAANVTHAQQNGKSRMPPSRR